MASAESVKAKLQKLIASANAATGNADSTLTDAVNNLVDGYGQGEDLLEARLSNTLTRYSNPNRTAIPNYGFYGCASLERVDCPNLTAIGQSAFSGCSALVDFDFSNVNLATGYGSTQAFSGTKLTNIVLPKTTVLPYNIFQGCSELATVDCHVVRQIQMQAFRHCEKLETLILRGDAVASIGNTNAFDGTPFDAVGSGGTVYVPAALIEDYKAATNWSVLYEGGTVNFVAIEGSEYE